MVRDLGNYARCLQLDRSKTTGRYNSILAICGHATVLLSVTPVVLFVKTTFGNPNRFRATLRVPSTRPLAISLAIPLMLFISFLVGYVEYST